MRISVSLIVNLVANGMPFDDIAKEYPDLTNGDIKQAMQAWTAGDVVYAPQGAEA